MKEERLSVKQKKKRRPKCGGGEEKTCGAERWCMIESPTVAPSVKCVVVGLDAIKLNLSADIIQMNGNHPIQPYDNQSPA